MSPLLFTLSEILRTEIVNFLKLFLLGVLISGSLATLVVVLRYRKGGLERPTAFWSLCSKLLLWTTLTAVGTTGALLWSGTVVLSRTLTRIDAVVLKSVDTDAKNPQTQAAPGQPQDSFSTLLNSVTAADVAERLSALGVPGSMDGLITALGTEVAPDASGKIMHPYLTKPPPPSFSVSLFNDRVLHLLNLLLWPIRNALIGALLFLGLLILVDKGLCLLLPTSVWR